MEQNIFEVQTLPERVYRLQMVGLGVQAFQGLLARGAEQHLWGVCVCVHMCLRALVVCLPSHCERLDSVELHLMIQQGFP